MNTFVIEHFDVDEQNKCNFYTVRMEDSSISETEKFYEAFEQDDSPYQDDFYHIHELIAQIAQRGENIIRRARDEAKAFALPPEQMEKAYQVNNFENNLRLFYVLLAPGIIVLLGGGIAHPGGKREPPPEYWTAQQFAKKILEAKSDAFDIEGNQLVPAGHEDVIVIY